MLLCAVVQGALKGGVQVACAVVRALGPMLPFPGEQAANGLLLLLDLAEQVRGRGRGCA